MNVKKKNCFLLVVLSILLCLSFSLSLPAEAAYENTHVNTGDQATDLVEVARTQVGYHEGTNNYTKYNVWFGSLNDYGYNYAWCQTFVAWCANQAGIPTSMIPRVSGTVSGMDFFKKNGTWKDAGITPEKGDIIYLHSKSSSGYHVGIVADVSGGQISTIEGNSSDQVAERSYSVGSSTIVGYGCPEYVRPNPPTYARLDKNQVWYDLQDTIELYPTSDKATDFWLTVKKDDTVIKSEHVDVGGSLKFYAGDYVAGNYYAWTTAYNSAGGVDSDGIDFSIVDGVGYSYIGSSQSAYSLSDEVSIKVDTICAKGQVIGIDRIGDGRVITESCDSPYTIPAKNLGTGLYGTYFSVYNGSACVDTKWDFFSIDNETEKPANVSLKADKDWYDADDNITLSPSSTNASIYWICIRKNGSDIVNQKIIGDYTFNATEYGCGEYYAWISAVNSCGSTDSSGITFSIVQSASYEDVYSKKDVYDIEDMVSLTVEPLFAEGQALHIDNADTGENILYVLSDETYRIEANKLGKGKFNAYFTVYNGTGSLNTEIIKFEIVYSKSIVGDCNNDGQFSIADIIALQKWLLNDDTELANWQAADFSKDNILNISDLCIMKNKLLSIEK